MSDESPVEIPENQQGLEAIESEPSSDDPELEALIKRYGLTPEQAEMLDLYL
jgi:hypothetical protein